MEKEGEVSAVDPDARLMRSGGDARLLDACYNVQTVVGGKHHLIVDFGIADRSDGKGNLLTMSEKAGDRRYFAGQPLHVPIRPPFDINGHLETIDFVQGVTLAFPSL